MWTYDASELDDALYGANIVATMAGELMVREGERGGPRVLDLARGDGGDDRDDREPFVDKPWEDAVRAYRARSAVRPDEFQRMLLRAAAQTREERRRLLEHLQETVRSQLAEAIGEGRTYRDFASDLREGVVPLGVSADDDGYLQMVFRTNVQQAYSDGRDRASKDPEILLERPFALYLTAGDGLVRSEHAEYAEKNGGVYRIGSAEWEAVRPPPQGSPFNCRCSWVTLTEEQARARGAQV